MRYLNKIVFINSAHIPYAPIDIDGNVHFIGTQGVGKSTILRAILFFYNADSTKLGISREKKSFVEYYFPYDDSYIIYEVKTENHFYCVCAYKAHGHICFKFMNSPFDKNYFIDASGSAFAEWKEVVQAVPKEVHITRRIDKYEEYRDIIFGNNKALAPEFRRYALIESRSYRNIPRTIQNVFLNSKLEAEFIKQTIIMSMEEEETAIDLSKYSRHIELFQLHLNDIGKWRQGDKQSGKNEVRLLADKVIDYWRNGKSLLRQREKLACQLNYAYRIAQESVPHEQNRLEKKEVLKEDIERKLGELVSRFKTREDKFKKEIALAQAKINESNRKLSDYEVKGIKEIIKQVGRKDELISTKTDLEQRLAILLLETKDINVKYEQLIQQERNAYAALLNIKQAAKVELKAKLNEAVVALGTQYAAIVEEIREGGELQQEELRDKIEHIAGEIAQLKTRKAVALKEQFYGDEIAACKQLQADLTEKKKDAERLRQAATGRIEMWRHQWESELATITKTAEYEVKEVQRKRSDAVERVKQIDELLLNRQGSMFEWLNAECPDWQETVGKVIDEENVLFNNNLSPRKVSGDNTLYGIELDLTEISKSAKSLKDYEKEKNQLDAIVTACVSELKTISEGIEAAKVKLSNKYNPLIKQAKDEVKVAEFDGVQADSRMKEQRVRLTELERNAEQEKAKRLEAIEEDTNAQTAAKMKSDDELTAIKEEIKRKVANRTKDKEANICDKTKEYNQSVEALNEEIRLAQQEHQHRLEAINSEKLNALGKRGLDTAVVRQIEEQIEKVKAELVLIDQNFALVVEYNKDKRELFDHLPDFKVKRQKAVDSLATEEGKFHQQKQRIDSSKHELQQQIDVQSEKLKGIQNNIVAVESFVLTEVYSYISDVVVEEKCDTECHTIIEALNDNATRFERNQNQFKETSRKFIGHFSADNIFGFKVELYSDDEFDAFADNLNDFIEDNRLERFEQEAQTRFVNIIHTFAKDMELLLEKEGEIQRVITDINRDFDSKGKFALVIKLIELRRVESERPIIVLLKQIQSFRNLHLAELGEMNLFSTSNTDKINKKAIELIKAIVKEINLLKDKKVTLSDSFDLQFRIIENDNDSGYVSKLSNVGSDGTDVLVKAMINIMLLNVFKEKASKKSNEFRLHCMMDEIGKLHPNNVKGILDFANARNILLVNSSPTTYRPVDYKYIYMLTKDEKSNTWVNRLINVGKDFIR